MLQNNICFTESDARALLCRFGYSRGALPHLSFQNGLFFISTRLFDSVPEEVIRKMRASLGLLEVNAMSLDTSSIENLRRIKELYNQIQRYEDAGHGACFLNKQEIAQIVYDAIKSNDNKEFSLLAWSIMPNHIHLVLRLLEYCETNPAENLMKIAKIMKQIKGRSAYQANKLLGRNGQSFWQKEYFERFIRDEQHLRNVVKYIVNNPQRAGVHSYYTGTIFDDFKPGKLTDCKL